MSMEAGRSGGLLGSLRRLGATVIEIIHTRVELFATELEEERARLARALWLAAIGGFCLAVGVMLLVLLVVLMFWDTHRLLVIALLACAFGAAGIAALVALRTLIGERRRMFAQSLAELRADRDTLSQ